MHIGRIIWLEPATFSSVAFWNVLVDIFCKPSKVLFGLVVVSAREFHQLEIVYSIKRNIEIAKQELGYGANVEPNLGDRL
jgi:hypothetical protein